MEEPMRKKVGTALHEHLIIQLRVLAASDDRPLNELIEEALERYLAQRELGTGGSVVSATEGTYAVTDDQLATVMAEDSYVGE